MPNEIITWKPAAFFEGKAYDELSAAQEAALMKLDSRISEDMAILIIDCSTDIIAILQASPDATKRIGRPKGSKTRKPATEPQTEDKK